MNSLKKATLGTIAAGAMAFTATPAMADDRGHRDRGGPSAGEVIAGALIIGGIAALATRGDRDRDRWRDRDRRFDRARGNPRRAINRCVRAAERRAMRAGGYRFADVTDIRRVRDTRWGWRVVGRIEVGAGRRADSGRFVCDFSRGRVVDIDYRGIRRLNRI